MSLVGFLRKQRASWVVAALSVVWNLAEVAGGWGADTKQGWGVYHRIGAPGSQLVPLAFPDFAS